MVIHSYDLYFPDVEIPSKCLQHRQHKSILVIAKEGKTVFKRRSNRTIFGDNGARRVIKVICLLTYDWVDPTFDEIEESRAYWFFFSFSMTLFLFFLAFLSCVFLFGTSVALVGYSPHIAVHFQRFSSSRETCGNRENVENKNFRYY